MKNRLLWLAGLVIVATLAACSTGVRTPEPALALAPSLAQLAPLGPLTGSLAHPKSRWVPAAWSDLPGFADDSMDESWTVLVTNCTRASAAFRPLCNDVRRLAIGSAQEQRQWMMERLQPYRVESLAGQGDGQLTSYYEPIFDASRQPTAQYTLPIYQVPAGGAPRQPWFTRQQIETLPQAQAALRGREIAWLADPIDVLMLHIQGSGRLRITEPNGARHIVRAAFAGSNEQPYRSVNQWLLGQGVTRINPWPDATKAWAAQNPQRVPQLLWSNPRYVFFREEPLSEIDASSGPRGAQGVPLTPGRSIAVDPGSIPYGTPVWLVSGGPSVQLNRLVVAQDTGKAIVGAVRADYFAGTGAEAGRLAASVNQPLRLWALWPK